MSKELDSAIKEIKAAGFSHIKVELEAELGRSDNSDCYDCGGRGSWSCDVCEGSGVDYYFANGEEHQRDCSQCAGDGTIECGECEGNNWGNASCKNFLLEHISAVALNSLNFSRFYNDGSVDSEFTFTLPIERADKVKEFILAMKQLGENIGNGLEVQGAGMHISVMKQGVYPCSTSLSQARLRNFKEQVRKLLPALYFVGSCDHRSRHLSYRSPNISGHGSAIALDHRGTIEYRLFETCYDRPEAFFDYIQVISKTLRFYADTKLKVPSLRKNFYLPEGTGVGRFYQTPEQMKILYRLLKYVKPDGKSLHELRKERGMKYNLSSLVKEAKKKRGRALAEYRQYEKEIDADIEKAKLRPLNKTRMDMFLELTGRRPISGIFYWKSHIGYRIPISDKEAQKIVRDVPKKHSFREFYKQKEQQGTAIRI